MAAQAPRYANRSPGPGVARRTFLPGIDAGLAVRIAVIALADHAGSRVIRVRGPATGHDVSVSDEPDQILERFPAVSTPPRMEGTPEMLVRQMRNER